jgi:hypothetical protein
VLNYLDTLGGRESPGRRKEPNTIFIETILLAHTIFGLLFAF